MKELECRPAVAVHSFASFGLPGAGALQTGASPLGQALGTLAACWHWLQWAALQHLDECWTCPCPVQAACSCTGAALLDHTLAACQPPGSQTGMQGAAAAA